MSVITYGNSFLFIYDEYNNNNSNNISCLNIYIKYITYRLQYMRPHSSHSTTHPVTMSIYILSICDYRSIILQHNIIIYIVSALK